ncbi:ABC transporter permease subunit [Bacillus sp. FJAT-47783]|uniref:ABC transporter permease n=1 Tax=Bacillus sp. FJAT-47783 TaxID=2922712 RepID=UPI001FAB3CCD|nr:ABC transporter permease subunit [Bacillus sp. FJAT-47783]
MKQKVIYIFASILFLVPILLLFIQSFTRQWDYGELFPSEFDIRSWHVLMSEHRLHQAILTSYFIGGFIVIGNLFIGMLAGKALAHENFKGKAFMESFLMLPIVIPSLAIAMGIHVTMIKWGLADQWIGVALVHLLPTVPYSIKMFRAAFDRIGMKWQEQAVSLGASKWNVFYTIYFPQLVPTIRASVFLTFVISLSQYALTSIIGGGNVMTLAMIYFPYFSTVDEAVMASFSIVFALLPLFFLIITEMFLRIIMPYQHKYIR